MISKLSDSNKDVSTAAYRALAPMSGPAQLKEVLPKEAIAASPANVGYVQSAIIAALLQVPAPERAAALKAMMSATPEAKQPLFYAVLAEIGNKSVLATISNTFAEANESDRKLSLEALRNWSGQEVFPILTILAKVGDGQDYPTIWEIYLAQVQSQPMTLENKRLFATNILNSGCQSAIKGAIAVVGGTKSYSGMMTVAPLMDSSDAAITEAACQAVLKIALGNSSYCGEEVIDVLERCAEKLNNPDAGYQKEAIKEHLLTLAKEGGYVSIFNGKDLTGWKGLVQNPIARQKMSTKELAKSQEIANEQMAKSWSVKDGYLYFNGAGDNICTDKMYGDFEMLIDWRLSSKSKEADAGIYLRGAPQVQIWDVSRTNVGAQVGSGGLYNNSNNSKPLKVADNALGEWNVLYIKMIGERVTVRLNGELVVSNVVMENYWNRAIPIFTKEQIELQAHGSEVEYRDIYIKEIAAPEALVMSEQEQEAGFKYLFDGSSMNLWGGDIKNYVCEDGAIVMYPAGHGGNLYTNEQYSDFVLRFDFWLTSGANSGLGIRTPKDVDAAYHGIELQIIDNEAPIYTNLAKYQYHGSVYGIAPAKRGALKEVGEWNTEEVIAKGNRIKVIVNGVIIQDVDIAEVSQNNTKTLDGRPHPGLLNKSGHIAFLGHGSHVKFKNIRIKTLD